MGNEWRPEERLFLNHRKERKMDSSGRRYFSRGGVKYALLELLEQESMHGYQMMKALEENSCGTYKPSAGSIYPTLQMLRDQGFIESSKQDGKKVFTITEEGKVFLLEEKEAAAIAGSVHDPEKPDERDEQAERAKAEHRAETKKPINPADEIHAKDAFVDESSVKGDSADGGSGEEPVKRNRRLTPAGRELLHLLKAAERAAISDATKAVQLRLIIDQLRHSLLQLTDDDASKREDDSE